MADKQQPVILVGGHWSPAQAVAEKLVDQGKQIYFIGRRYSSSQGKTDSWEYSECQRLGYDFLPLDSARFHRHSWWQTWRELPRFFRACYRSWQYLRQLKPVAVVSFGGYLSLPVGLAAKLMGIRLIIHEQTATAGLANRVLARLADKVAISFPSSQAFFPQDKLVFVGNPVRSQLLNSAVPKKSHQHTHPTILVMGGNQGFARLNRLILEALPEWCQKYRLVHSFGRHPEQQPLYQAAVRLAKNCRSYQPFLFLDAQQLAKHLIEADLVISRAGANTCYELALLNQPAILIPLEKTGQTGEQQANANWLQRLGLVEVLSEPQLSVKQLERLIDQMLANLPSYRLSRKQQEKYFPQDAAAALAQLVLKND